MRNRFLICLALLVVISGLFFTVSCAKKTIITEASMSQASQEEAKAETATKKRARQEEDARQKELEMQRKLAMQQAALEEERLREQSLREMALVDRKLQEENARQIAETQRKIFSGELILFSFDSVTLTPEAQERLTKKAKWLQENSGIKIVIEGHCDERGSTEYNLALGEMRAEAVAAFLLDMGISASRLTTVSYGKERPFVKGHHEGAWSLNRRAHFVIE